MVEELYTPEQLAKMHDSLWQCVLQFANLSAAQERNRIARDLHDSVGHALTALNFQLQTAIKLYKPDPNQAEEFLNEAQRLVKLATQEVRQSVKALRSDSLESQPLETLVQSLVDDLQSTIGITPIVNLDIQVPPPSHLVVPAYRIIQETLNNIRKYAEATEVKIEICANEHELLWQICDNGRGFDPDSVAGGYGLKGMRERVAVLQGLFLVESSPGNGCKIAVWLPARISAPSLGAGVYDSGLKALDASTSSNAISALHNQTAKDAQPISEQTPLPDLSSLMSEINLDLSHVLTNDVGENHRLQDRQQEDTNIDQPSIGIESKLKISEWQIFDLQLSVED